MQLTDIERKALDLMTELGLEFCERKILRCRVSNVEAIVKTRSNHRNSQLEGYATQLENLVELRNAVAALKTRVMEE